MPSVVSDKGSPRAYHILFDTVLSNRKFGPQNASLLRGDQPRSARDGDENLIAVTL